MTRTTENHTVTDWCDTCDALTTLYTPKPVSKIVKGDSVPTECLTCGTREVRKKY